MNRISVIPTRPEEVTPAWMSGALHAAGRLRQSRVTALRSAAVGSQGVIGRVFRFELDFDTWEEGQVSSLMVKLPQEDPQARKDLQIMHEREIQFYKDLGANPGIPVPVYIYSEMDGTNGDNILLLEDLSASARAGCLVCGCSLEEAHAAVVFLAKFHARWWNSERLAQFDWLKHKGEWLADYPQEYFSKDMDELLARIWAEMPDFDCSPAFLRTTSALAKNYTRLKKYLCSAPVTLIHDDYHLDNMLFRGEGEDVEPVIIDWQCISKGPAVCDLGYFIRFCLSPEQQSLGENALLNTYYKVLCENGVARYEYNRFLLDYQLSLLEPFERLVQVRGALNQSFPRGFAIFEAVLSRIKPVLENSRIVDLIA
jgi:hypothetical protein